MLKRYLSNSSGNIAVITGLTLGIMMLGIGVAVDYSGSTSEYARMQTALDTAVLAAAADAGEDDAYVKAIVENTVRQNFAPTKPGDLQSLDVDVTVNENDIAATVSLDYSTSIMGMFGRPTMPLTVQSGGPRNNVPTLNVALVVDTTDSMSGGNMADLQAAVGELIDALEDTGADVRMALVPYGQYVNVGLNRQNAGWVDARKIWEEEGEAGQLEVPNIVGGTPPTCVRQGPPEPIYGSRDGIIYDTGNTRTPCLEWQPGTDGVEDGINLTPTFRYEREYEFNGCMGSREAPDNLRPEASRNDPIPAAMSMTQWRMQNPDGSFSPWSAPGADDYRVTMCGQVITPLTKNLNRIRNRVDALTTSGQTYLPSGLIWGWRVLDPSTPFRQAAKYPNAKSVMIFMTDGENSARKGREYHRAITRVGAFSIAQAESGLNEAAALCEGIKGDDIEVYTVAYNLQGGLLQGQTAGMLSTCASSTSYAFTPDNRAELIENFRAITANLAEVRLEY